MPLLPPSERWPAWVNRLLLTARQALQPDPPAVHREGRRARAQEGRRPQDRRPAHPPAHPLGLQPPILNQSLNLNLNQSLSLNLNLNQIHLFYLENK